MRVIVTRPDEDGDALCRTLEDLGHAPIRAPLMRIVPRAGAIIPDLPWQAVVATSANGIRALGDAGRLTGVPMLTVGPQSLAAARAAGFAATAHGGDVDGLSAYIASALKPDAGPILYLSGAATAGDLKGQIEAAGFACHRAIVYDAVPATDLGDAAAALREGAADAVLLYSPRSARIWRELAEGAGLASWAAAIATLCLSRNVAAALPDGWQTRVAEKPENAAMLRLLEELQRTR